MHISNANIKPIQNIIKTVSDNMSPTKTTSVTIKPPIPNAILNILTGKALYRAGCYRLQTLKQTQSK